MNRTSRPRATTGSSASKENVPISAETVPGSSASHHAAAMMTTAKNRNSRTRRIRRSRPG